MSGRRLVKPYVIVGGRNHRNNDHTATAHIDRKGPRPRQGNTPKAGEFRKIAQSFRDRRRLRRPQLQYGSGFVKPDDHVLESEGYKAVVDPKSIEFLKGMQVDYYETVQSSGFKFNNPNAIASCGCGLSFKTAQKSETQKAKPCH